MNTKNLFLTRFLSVVLVLSLGLSLLGTVVSPARVAQAATADHASNLVNPLETLPVPSADGDPIPGYLSQVSETYLTDYVTALVGFGPRLVNTFQVYTDDNCTYGSTIFDVNNLDRAANSAKSIFEGMGYTTVDTKVVLEDTGSYGHNVVATKKGSVYPDIFIEFGAHLDTKPGTPGANDNGSGSAAVLELARVLKDYPSRYSMTFGLWVGEETAGFAGAYYHIDHLGAGKQIKVGLNMDNMGQIGAGNIYRNDIWTNNAESQRVWDIFNQVNTQYDLGLTLVNNANSCCSDERAYWARGLTAVTSVGGWTPSSPNYHQCGDVVSNFTAAQAARVAKQNLAAALKLDMDLVPPTVTLSLDRSTMPADGASTAVATATVKDSNNNPLTSETVTFTASGDISIGAVTNHGDGTYSATLTASSTVGPQIITATDNGSSATATITLTTYCPGLCFTDTSTSDFNGGTTGASTYISETLDGEVILTPTVGSEFSGSALPAGWTSAPHGTGEGTVTVQNGWMTIDGKQVYTSDPTGYSPGRVLEFSATFGGGQYQAAGFSVDATTGPWAVFDYDALGTTLTAYTNGEAAVNITGTWSGNPHLYRIEWGASSIVYYIDGFQKASTAGITGSMRPIMTDQGAGAQVNQINWMRMSPYASSGTFESRIFDGGSAVNWGEVNWSADKPTGTDIVISVRGGNTSSPDGTWTDFSPVTNGATIGLSRRYLQYQVLLNTTNPDQTPTFREISLKYTPGSIGEAVKLGFLVQPTGAVAGIAFSTQPRIAVQDASGYTVITDNTTQVTLSIGTNPSGGVLTCNTNPVTVVNGEAQFSGCKIDKTGIGYRLSAAGGSLTAATSSAFNVSQAAPASITLSLNPDTIAANASSTSVATATVRDSTGNLLTGQTVQFSTSGDVTFGSVTDQNDGTYQVTITASTSPGDETITATVASISASATLHETPNCPGICYFDTTYSDFSSGTPGSATYVAQTENGEVILMPTVGSEFTGSTLPSGWSANDYGGTQNVAVSDGKVSIGTARLWTDGLFDPGHVLEFSAKYSGGLYQAGGFGYNFNSADGYIWSTFDTVNVGNALYANTNNTYIPIPGSWLGDYHHYRLEWTATGVTYFIDGVQKDTRSATFARQMRPIFADNQGDANFLQVDWARMSPYASTGTYLSRVMDGGGAATWGVASWIADIPIGTTLVLSARSGDTPTPDGTWSSFSPITNGLSINVNARYLQYQAVLSTTNPDITPTLKDICFSYSETTPPTIVSKSPAPGTTDVPISAIVTVGFSEVMNAATINSSTIRLRGLGDSSDTPAVVSYTGVTATLTPNAPLALAKQYQVTVDGTVSDLHSNPMGSTQAWNFATGGGSFTDTTVAHFGAGTVVNGLYISLASSGGEIILMPTVVNEFSGDGDCSAILPAGWTSTRHNSTDGTCKITGGEVVLDGVKVYTNALYGSGRSVDFAATLGGSQYQAIGFADSGTNPPWAVFDFASTNVLVAWNSTTGPSPEIFGSWIGISHRYRIDWGVSDIKYYINDYTLPKVTQTVSGLVNMRVFLGDYGPVGSSHLLKVDWVRMSPYATEGTFESRIFEASQKVDWTDLSYTATIPSGTTLTFKTRSSDDNITWSAWEAVNSPISSPDGRYIQYQAHFTSTDDKITPTLQDVTLNYTIKPTGITVSSFTGASQGVPGWVFGLAGAGVLGAVVLGRKKLIRGRKV